jgi:O-methyltransferase involved in polyketide biosynthesis
MTTRGIDFEAGASWHQALVAAGFAADRPAVVASAGVSMYLTRDANLETLRQAAALAPGSTFVLSFLVPFELAGADARPGLEQSSPGDRASSTPFINLFEPGDLLTLAREAGFRDARHVSASALAQRCFAGRTDGLRPPSSGEELRVAST